MTEEEIKVVRQIIQEELGKRGLDTFCTTATAYATTGISPTIVITEDDRNKHLARLSEQKTLKEKL